MWAFVDYEWFLFARNKLIYFSVDFASMDHLGSELFKLHKSKEYLYSIPFKGWTNFFAISVDLKAFHPFFFFSFEQKDEQKNKLWPFCTRKTFYKNISIYFICAKRATKFPQNIMLLFLASIQNELNRGRHHRDSL